MTDSRDVIEAAVMALVSQTTVPVTGQDIAKRVNATRGIAAWSPIEILKAISRLVDTGHLAWDNVSSYMTVR